MPFICQLEICVIRKIITSLFFSLPSFISFSQKNKSSSQIFENNHPKMEIKRNFGSKITEKTQLNLQISTK